MPLAPNVQLVVPGRTMCVCLGVCARLFVCVCVCVCLPYAATIFIFAKHIFPLFLNFFSLRSTHACAVLRSRMTASQAHFASLNGRFVPKENSAFIQMRCNFSLGIIEFAEARRFNTTTHSVDWIKGLFRGATVWVKLMASNWIV